MKTLFTCFCLLVSICLFGKPCPDDTTPPVISGDDLDTLCTVDLFNNPYSDFITVEEESDCGLESVVFSIVNIIHSNCDDDYTKIYTVNWIAEDKAGNQSMFQQTITIQRPLLEDVVFPADTMVHCRSEDFDSAGLYGEPTIENVPVNMLCGMRVKFNLLDTMPSIEMSVCGTEVRKEWILLDCEGNERRDTQFISLIDTLQPIIACSTLESEYVLTADSELCCVEFEFPAVNASDYCTAREDLVYRYTIDGSFTGVSTILKPGTYDAAILVSDECMNTDTCNFIVQVLDETAPDISCTSDLIIELETSPEDVDITDLSLDIFDCSGIERIGYRLSSDIMGSYDSLQTFTCDDIGAPIQLDIWAIDIYGNENVVDTCFISIIDDVDAICPDNLIAEKSNFSSAVNISDKYKIDLYWTGNAIAIDSEVGLRSVDVLDVQGRLVRSVRWEDSGVFHPRISMPNLGGSGIYIVRINSFDDLMENVKLSILK